MLRNLTVENSKLFRMGAGKAGNMLGLKKKKEQSRRYLLLAVNSPEAIGAKVKSLQPNAPLKNAK